MSDGYRRPNPAVGILLVLVVFGLIVTAVWYVVFRDTGFQDRIDTSAIDDACPYQQTATVPFPDVEFDDPHGFAIYCLSRWKLLEAGEPYRPNEPVPRGQLATFLSRLSDVTDGALPTGAADAFTDDDGSVHEPALNRLAAAGIITGSGGGTVAPIATVTRGQLATFVVRWYEHRTGEQIDSSVDAFTDDDGSPHEPAINAAASFDFIGGVGEDRYAPSEAVNRAQLATILARVIDQLVEDGLAEPAPA